MLADVLLLAPHFLLLLVPQHDQIGLLHSVISVREWTFMLLVIGAQGTEDADGPD